MDLLDNPFYILNATTRDGRRRLMELSEERSLMMGSGDCAEARSMSTNPRRRLSVEIAWLPGLSPKSSAAVLQWLSNNVRGRPNQSTMNAFSPLARANILASGLQRLDKHTAKVVSQWILELARAYEEISSGQVMAAINDERIASGFPEVTDLSMVDAEIQARRLHYRQSIKAALNSLPASELVNAVTVAVETATENGEKHGPVLLDDIVDTYEVEAQEFLRLETGSIRALVEQIRDLAGIEEASSALSTKVSRLIGVVKNWDTVAQPIQVCAKSRGLDHDASRQVADLLRELAIELFNEHDQLKLCQEITEMLQEVFAEVDEVVEQTILDAQALRQIAEQRSRLMEDAKKQEEQWRREITFQADLGSLFKSHLSISPEGIEWKGRKWKLDSITHVRWGGTRHSVNGIPSGTTYKIVFGAKSDVSTIDIKKEDVYSNFVDRLWKSVGVRLLTEFLEGLRDGKEYRFGNAVVRDQGIDLVRSKFFSGDEIVSCRWSELVIWDGPGVFCIGKKEDKKLAAEFSYQNENNIHILNSAVRMFWERGGDRLSSVLGE